MLRKLWLVFIVLVPLLLLVTACGGGGGEKTATPTSTSTLTATPSPTETSKATPTAMLTVTPTSTEPIKIGAVNTWSGPAAAAGFLADKIISLVEEQVKNQGGILGGRMVKFIKGDDGGAVSGATTAAKKLILEDKVVMMTLGGVSGAHSTAVSDVCEELKIPYAAYTTVDDIQDRKYTVELYGHTPAIKANVGFLVNVLKPKTIAILAKDDESAHIEMDGLKVGLKAAGIDIIYEQYFNLTTQDFSAYLSTI
jgi:ABC-type branched-subunit amino acid transport system substrate-binding protein